MQHDADNMIDGSAIRLGNVGTEFGRRSLFPVYYWLRLEMKVASVASLHGMIFRLICGRNLPKT